MDVEHIIAQIRYKFLIQLLIHSRDSYLQFTTVLQHE
jgi:hypothetical protein